jgi:hypothetical protein
VTILVARSISRPVWDLLQQRSRAARHFLGRVLGVFPNACNLITPEDDVIALVTPQAGDGPLNIVVPGEEGAFAALKPGAAVSLEKGTLQIGRFQVALGQAGLWEPQPDWDALQAQRPAISSQLPRLWTIVLQHGPADSLLALPSKGSKRAARAEPGSSSSILAAIAREAADVLQAGRDGDLAYLQHQAVQLAGLGAGLTPSGDDFLCGVMLWAWLSLPTPYPFCRTLARIAASRTTALSGAFLRAAAEGQCDARWHRLLQVLASGMEEGLEDAARAIMAHGATSGADTLAGFLWLGEGVAA